jgi:RNA polymerase sigma-32 factor
MSLQVGSAHARSDARERSCFLTGIQQFQVLKAQQEYVLAKSCRELGDRNAAHRLVTSHLRLVAKIARGYRGYGLPLSDLISEGNIGLIQAIRRFEPDRGVRLATYANWFIRAAMQKYILHSWSLVKIGTTTNQKKLFFNLRRAKKRIGAIEAEDIHPDHARSIARLLGIAEQEVVEMNRRIDGDISLNAKMPGTDSGEWQDWLIDDGANQEARLAESEEDDYRRRALKRGLTVLNEREHRIFVARHLAEQPSSLSELAEELGISRERVRQIDHRTFKKMRAAVTTGRVRRWVKPIHT